VKAGCDSDGIFRMSATRGDVSMNLVDDKLYVYLERWPLTAPKKHGRTVYYINFGFIVETKTMTYEPLSKNMMEILNSYWYSADRYIRTLGDKIIFIDNPVNQDVVMNVFDKDVKDGIDTGEEDVLDETTESSSGYKLIKKLDDYFAFGDSSISISDVQTGDSKLLITGLSDPQSHPINGKKGIFLRGSGEGTANVFLLSTDHITGKSTYRWLTKYNPTKDNIWVDETPRITKVASNRYVVTYQVSRGKKFGESRSDQKPDFVYKLVNENGIVLKTKVWKNKFFPIDMNEPVYSNGMIYFLTNQKAPSKFVQYLPDGSLPQYLHALNVKNPKAPKFV
jgi:hypothetical protein